MSRTIGKYKVNIIVNSDQSQYISEKDREMDKRARCAVESAINKAKVCNKPIAKYNLTEKKAYLEYSDGRKKYVE